MKKSYALLCSFGLVGVQFSCLVSIFLTGPLIAESFVWRTVECISGLLAGWAIWAMQLRHVHIMPDVKAGSLLSTRGPYRFIRHPMYGAVLMVSLAVVCDQFTWWRFLVWLILLGDLLVKMAYEEFLLIQRFPEYSAYRDHTSRLIPWIY